MKNRSVILSLIPLLFPVTSFAMSRITYSGHATTTAIQLFTTPLVGAVQDDFAAFPSSIFTVLEGTISSSSYTDVIVNHYSSGSILYSCKANAFSTSSPVTFLSVDPAIATIDQDGTVTYVSDGTALFNIYSGRRTKQVECPLLRTVNKYTSTVGGLVASTTLANALTSNVADHIQGLASTSATVNIFSSTNDGAHIYVRNPNNFANAITTTTPFDLTALPSLGPLGMTGSGILVAPDIMITVWHICPGNNGTEYFTDASNNTFGRDVTGIISLGTTFNEKLQIDICILKLASDVPASIHPAKVFPPGTFGTKISPSAATSRSIPIMFTNQTRRLGINTLYMMSTDGIWSATATSSDSIFYPWSYQPYTGDSGTGCFSELNGAMIAIGAWSNPLSCDNISSHEPEINAAMTSLGSPYQLTPVDLSAYPSF